MAPNRCVANVWETMKILVGNHTTDHETSNTVLDTTIPRYDRSGSKVDEAGMPKVNTVIRIYFYGRMGGYMNVYP